MKKSLSLKNISYIVFILCVLVILTAFYDDSTNEGSVAVLVVPVFLIVGVIALILGNSLPENKVSNTPTNPETHKKSLEHYIFLAISWFSILGIIWVGYLVFLS